MPRKTSFSLSDEDDAVLKAKMAEGVKLGEIMRRGAGAADPDLVLARAVAAEAAAATAEAVNEDLEARIDRAVERAFAKRQGGTW